MTGLTMTGEPPANADLRVRATDTVTGTWRQLFDETQFPEYLVTAARTLATGRTKAEFYETIGGEVTGLDGLYETVAESLTDDQSSDAFWDALRTTRSLGLGRPFGIPTAVDDIHTGPLALLRLADVEPSLVIHVGDALEEANDPRRLVEWFVQLAETFDVTLAARRLTRAKLWSKHRDLLPASVSDPVDPTPREPPGVDVQQLVADGDVLAPDSRKVKVLRGLADEPSETLSYHALASLHEVDASRIRQIVTSGASTSDKSLTDLGLVETFGRRGNKQVELTPAGSEFLDVLNEQTTRQRDLSDFVSEPFDSSDHGRVITRTREGGEDPRRKGTGAAPVQPLGRAHAAGAAASAPENGIAVVERPVEEVQDYRQAAFFHDWRADRVVVSAEFANPMQWWVSIARALTSWRMFEYALTEDRLESADHDFADLFEEHREILRGSRCLGHLPDTVETAADYVDELQEARNHLEDLTTKYRSGDYEDEDRFRGTILREALGLAGTMTHVLDLADIDLVREVRLPKFTSYWDSDRWEMLTTTVAKGTAIASKYEQAALYRMLFDDRDDKVDQAIPPEVDAADPHGELIGSFVLTGPFNSKQDAFVEDLRDAVSSPAPVREDAPEVAVGVDVHTTTDRQAFADAVDMMCEAVNLRPSREAVSVICLLTGTPYDAAEALRWLSAEDQPREIRLDEVRYALAGLGPDRLVPHEGQVVGKIVATLLCAERALSPTEVIDRADVGRSTFYRHRDRMAALGLLQETEDGLRFPLPFHTDDGRLEDVAPLPIAGDDVLVRDVCHRLAEALVDDPQRWGDPDDPICGAWLDLDEHGFPDLARLLEAWGWLDPWVDVLEAALDVSSVINRERPDPVEFGATIEQTPLQAAAQGGAAG